MAFKVATFNVNSLRARMGILADWMAAEQPDVLCLQETKVQDKDFPIQAFREAGYFPVHWGQKAYNGVAIIGRRPPEESRIGLYGRPDEAARLVEARFGDLRVVNAYVPQGFEVGSDKFQEKLAWLRDLLSHLQKRYATRDPLLVVGDFNVALDPRDVFDPEGLRGQVGFHPEEQEILSAYLTWGLVDLFRERHPEGGHYTFWDYRIPNAFKRRMGWRIDYLLGTKPVAERCLDIRIDTRPRTLTKPSDHTPVVAVLDL
jgi:exodeoxyribonuclease-3